MCAVPNIACCYEWIVPLTPIIVAKTVVRLWYMERQMYRTIMTNKSKKKREQLMGFLKTWVYTLNLPTCTLLVTRTCTHPPAHSANSALICLCIRSQTLKALNDSQLSKIIDSMEEVCTQPFDTPLHTRYIFQSINIQIHMKSVPSCRWSTRTMMSLYVRGRRATRSTSFSKERYRGHVWWLQWSKTRKVMTHKWAATQSLWELFLEHPVKLWFRIYFKSLNS